MSLTPQYNAPRPARSPIRSVTAKRWQGNGPRQCYHRLIHIETRPEFLPAARTLANQHLSRALERMEQPDMFPELRYFEYSRVRFERRLATIQSRYHEQYRHFDVAARIKQTSREKLIEALRQFAPLNLVDGAWLQNIHRAGTLGRAQAFLEAIWRDECGNGEEESSHAWIYRELLHSVGVDMPDITERAFVEQVDVKDAAFVKPVFILAISQFPREFFPELLGMTLYYEWEASASTLPVVELLEHPGIGIDPTFFRLHVEVDNVKTGHGYWAREAVREHLDSVAREQGSKTRQEHWRRIWSGYVALATADVLEQELQRSCTRMKCPCLL